MVDAKTRQVVPLIVLLRLLAPMSRYRWTNRVSDDRVWPIADLL